MISIESEDFKQVEKLLGRPPQGLEEIMRRDPHGMPSVIRVRSLIDDRPFPTLFWLVDKALCYALDGLEARGLIQEIQQELNSDANMQSEFENDHRRHVALRDKYMSPKVKADIARLGYSELFKKRGIGGIENYASVRCLHTYYAAHLVQPNALGRMLEADYRYFLPAH